MSRILEKLADQHEERIINVLYRLEDDVIKEVRKATKGELISQRLAIQLRPQLRNVIENTFLNEADLIINEEYNKIAKEVLDNFGALNIPKKFKSLTEVDLQTINALKFQSFSGFEDIAERFLKVINDEVYQSTIAGRPFDDMVNNIRSHINGVYRKSNSAEINELVDFINENKFDTAKKAQVDDAIRKLHTQYASDRAGNNLRRYAGQIAHDSVMQFHGQFTVAKAKEAGIDKFTYTGTLVRDSRDFCVGMLNKVLTEEQIREIWNSRGWQGKSTGDPFIVRGGYRCRHTWIPTVEEVVDEPPLEPEVEETPAPPTVVEQTDIFEPINRKGITEQTIKLISAKDGAKLLNDQFKEASKDTRYLNRKNSHFSKRTADDFGKAKLNGLTDEAVSMLVALKPELDTLSDKFNIPRLRGFKTSTNKGEFLANMGDGVMGIQIYFANGKARNIGKTLKEISEKDKFVSNKKIQNLEKDLNKFQDRMKNILGFENGLATKSIADLTVAERTIFESNRKAVNELQEQISNLKENIGSSSLVTSKWKRGDNLNKRPEKASENYDNFIDQFRSTYYHEVGHHVHQTYKQRLKERFKNLPKALFADGEPNYRQVDRPLEKRLNKVKNINQHSPSNYGGTNTREWFAENFSLFYMGKEDLVAPEFIKILQEIKDDKI